MESAEDISISVPLEMMRLIREDIGKGRYGSPSDAIRDALRLWQREREEHEVRLRAIRQRVHSSLDDPRPSLTLEEIRGNLDALAAKLAVERENG